MSSKLLQPPPVLGDVLSIPLDPKLRRGYYSSDPMAETPIKIEQQVDPKIGGETPRLGDQNLMRLLKEFTGSVETTKKAMPSQLDWRR
jgi:hypothetical protein